MDTNELKAEVDKFLQKLQESIVKKPAGPSPSEVKAPQTIKASHFVKGKPNVLKKEVLKAAKECASISSESGPKEVVATCPQCGYHQQDWESLNLAVPHLCPNCNSQLEIEGKPMPSEEVKCPTCDYHWIGFQHGKGASLFPPKLCPKCGSDLLIVGAPQPPTKFAKITQGEKSYSIPLHDDEDGVPVELEAEPEFTNVVTVHSEPIPSAAAFALDDKKELEGFYAELLKVVNLLADTVEQPPSAITLFLKNGKYEFVKVTIVDKTIAKVEVEEVKEVPEATGAAAEPSPLPKSQVPLAYPEKVEVELSLGKDLVDVLLQVVETLKQFMKQQDGGIIE